MDAADSDSGPVYPCTHHNINLNCVHSTFNIDNELSSDVSQSSGGADRERANIIYLTLHDFKSKNESVHLFITHL